MKSHGGDVLRRMQQRGLIRSQLVDFSASINPLGMPFAVETALQESLPLLGDYPEIDAGSLRNALADHHALSDEMVLPANGSTSLIYLLPRVLKPRRATLISPCFSEYRPALEQAGCRVDLFQLLADNDFIFNAADLLDSLTEETDMVWLANPGNPAGNGIAPEILIDLAATLDPVRLIVDEAFVDFCPELSLVSALRTHPNLVLLRSMTKFYAIPGLRVGYLLATPEIVSKLSDQTEPWNLSTPAILAALACLEDNRYRERSLAGLPPLRDAFILGLTALGFKVFPACANYLLLKFPDGGDTALRLKKQLAEQRVLIRSCEDFNGLGAGFMRLAVRTAEENALLLRMLKESLGKK